MQPTSPVYCLGSREQLQGAVPSSYEEFIEQVHRLRGLYTMRTAQPQHLSQQPLLYQNRLTRDDVIFRMFFLIPCLRLHER